VQYAGAQYAGEQLPSALKNPKYGGQEMYPQFHGKNFIPPANQFPAGMGSTRSMLSKQSSGRSSAHSTRSASSGGYPAPPENGDAFQDNPLQASFSSLGRQEEALIRPMIRQSSGLSMNGSIQSRQSESFAPNPHRSSRSLAFSTSSRGSAAMHGMTEDSGMSAQEYREEMMAAEAQQRVSSRRLN